MLGQYDVGYYNRKFDLMTRYMMGDIDSFVTDVHTYVSRYDRFSCYFCRHPIDDGMIVLTDFQKIGPKGAELEKKYYIHESCRHELPDAMCIGPDKIIPFI